MSVLQETKMKFADVPAYVQELLAAEKPVALSTVYRWANSGHNGVKLEYIQAAGCGRYTSKEAIARMFSSGGEQECRTEGLATPCSEENEPMHRWQRLARWSAYLSLKRILLLCPDWQTLDNSQSLRAMHGPELPERLTVRVR